MAPRHSYTTCSSSWSVPHRGPGIYVNFDLNYTQRQQKRRQLLILGFVYVRGIKDIKVPGRVLSFGPYSVDVIRIESDFQSRSNTSWSDLTNQPPMIIPKQRQVPNKSHELPAHMIVYMCCLQSGSRSCRTVISFRSHGEPTCGVYQAEKVLMLESSPSDSW